MALAITLALASGTAAALGLGQIELKSRLGQPLLAEIPIISNDPAELEQLRASLPSPETFRRIGLQLPDEFVASLQFTSALDAKGNPVIRVTSVEPVTDPLLTFLVEVDWGQGRLVREYSALVDAPRTVAAPVQPSIEAPVVAPSNTIMREPDVASVPEAVPADEAAPDSAATPAQPVAAVPAEPEPDATDANAIPVQAEPAAIQAAPEVAASPSAAASEYAVKRGDTLSGIANSFNGDAYSLNQAMIALLRANPDAFIDGNINLLKQGAVLRVPQGDALSGVDADEATAVVRSQVQQWREARRPVPQPEMVDSGERVARGGDAAPAAATRRAQRTADARLEIVPPGASAAKRAGTQSGIDAGGEGEMLRQELQQTKESLAARDAELAEMKARVADLEKLQQQQQQLMTLKDSELAAAEQRLAQSNEKAEASQSGSTQQQAASPMPWVLGGTGLLALALLGWWFQRRRKAATAVFRAPVAAAGARPSVADAFAAPSDGESVEASRPDQGSPRAPATAARDGNAWNPDVPNADAPASDEGPLPFWDRRERTPMPSKRAPTWHSENAPAGEATVAEADPVGLGDRGAGSERLELARAYIDLGDSDSARQLLSEVAINGDHSARQQAARMLRELE